MTYLSKYRFNSHKDIYLSQNKTLFPFSFCSFDPLKLNKLYETTDSKIRNP